MYIIYKPYGYWEFRFNGDWEKASRKWIIFCVYFWLFLLKLTKNYRFEREWYHCKIEMLLLMILAMTSQLFESRYYVGILLTCIWFVIIFKVYLFYREKIGFQSIDSIFVISYFTFSFSTLLFLLLFWLFSQRRHISPMQYLRSDKGAVTFYRSSHSQIFFKICRSSHRRCSIKKVFLRISQNSQEKTCARVSFLIKLQGSCLQGILRILKNLFIRTLRGDYILTKYNLKLPPPENCSSHINSFMAEVAII